MDGKVPERKQSVDSSPEVSYATYQSSRRPTITKTYERRGSAATSTAAGTPPSRAQSLSERPASSLHQPIDGNNFFGQTQPRRSSPNPTSSNYFGGIKEEGTPYEQTQRLREDGDRMAVEYVPITIAEESPSFSFSHSQSHKFSPSHETTYAQGSGKLSSLLLQQIVVSPHYDVLVDASSPFWTTFHFSKPTSDELKPGQHFYYTPQKGGWTLISPFIADGELEKAEVGPCNSSEDPGLEHHWIERARPAMELPESGAKESIDARSYGLKRGWLGVAICSACGKKVVWSTEAGGWNNGFGPFLRHFSRAGREVGYQTLWDGWYRFWIILSDLLFKPAVENRTLNFQTFAKPLSWADPQLLKDMISRLGYTDCEEVEGIERVKLPIVDGSEEGKKRRRDLVRTWAEVGVRLYSLKEDHKEEIIVPENKFIPLHVFQAVETLKRVFGPIVQPVNMAINAPAFSKYYEVLGIREISTDQLIEFAYRRQRASNRRNHAYYLEALSRIGDVRGSEYLKGIVVQERSCGLYTTSDIEKAFLDLTCPLDASEDMISKKFNDRWHDNTDPAIRHDLLEALNIIATERESDLLKSTWASCKEGPREPAMDIEKARLVLGHMDDMDDEMLLALYDIRIMDSPGLKDQMKTALEVIAKQRNSEALLEFVKTGQKPSPGAFAAAKAARPDFPVGLENIANTCYLNSLLQYFFTIKDLREIILQADQFEEDDTSSKLKRVGGREVTKPEIERSRRFIILLQHLFLTLLTTKDGAVVPEIELAKLALVPGKEEEPHSNPTESTEATLVDHAAPAHLPSPTTSVLGKRGSEHLDEREGMEVEGLTVASPKRRSVDEDYDMVEEEEEATPVRRFEPSRQTVAVPDEDKTMIVDESVEASASSSVQDGTHEDVGMEIAPPPLPPRPENPPTEFGPALPPPDPKSQMSLEQQVASYMSFGKQNDVSECLDNIMFQIESALDSEKLAKTKVGTENLVKDLFYGRTVQELRFTNPTKDEEPRIKEEEFFHLLVDVAEEGRDLYDGLDASFDESDVEIEGRTAQRSVMIKDLPPILHIQLQRVQYDRILKRTYKSNAHMAYSPTITMDRYCTVDPTNNQAVERKERTRTLRKELDEQRSRLTRIKQGSKKPPITEVMKLVYESLPKRNNPIELECIPDVSRFLEHLMQEKIYLENEIQSTEKRIKELKDEIDEVWKSCHEADYELASVFMHRGEANYGHYFLLQRTFSPDSESPELSSRWLKLNDSQVTEIPQKDVLEFPEGTGSANAANPYFLSFVRKGKENYFEKIQRQMD
ncbi:cysteine proteinase [Atractiella rhizophila]|nr:cysteine proteinase [Atractiella rhizophila]